MPPSDLADATALVARQALATAQSAATAAPVAVAGGGAKRGVHIGSNMLSTRLSGGQVHWEDPVRDCSDIPHWHFVGGCWRPLHELLNALSDAATWAAASAESPAAPGIAAPVAFSEEFKVAWVQCGHDYAVMSVSGALDGGAIRRLRTLLRGVIEGDVRNLLIDLSQASCGDSRLGAVLDHTETSLRVRQGRLILLNVPGGIRSCR
ncbi:MAG: hypothetical protein QOE71_1404 [Pseudonocardiales bacterium]|nr:hypothetical protein [Pseudonocardiales bacterium]